MIINTKNKSVWLVSGGAQTRYPSLEEDTEAEVVVVGSGLTAVMIAREFAKSGHDTVLVGADQVGMGGTSRCSGMMSLDSTHCMTCLMQEIGPERAVMVMNMLHNAMNHLEGTCASLPDTCGFCRRDSLCYIDDVDEVTRLRREFSLRYHANKKATWLDADNAATLFTFPMEAGILSSNLGAHVNPLRLTRALAADGCKAGLRLYENTVVSDVEEHEDGLHIHCRPGGMLHADYVVMAAGLRTGDMCGGLLEKYTTFQIATEPVERLIGWYGPAMLYKQGTPRLFATVTDDGRILAGGLDSQLMDESGHIGMVDLSRVAERKYKLLHSMLLHMFPLIPDLTAEYCFAVQDGRTKDTLPIIGRKPESSHIAYALCCGDNSILYADLASRLLVDQYHGECHQELALFSPNRKWKVKR